MNYVVNFLVQSLWTITIGMLLWKVHARSTPHFRPPERSAVSGFFGWIYYSTVFELWGRIAARAWLASMTLVIGGLLFTAGGHADGPPSIQNVPFSTEQIETLDPSTWTITDEHWNDYGGGVWLWRTIERPPAYHGYVRVKVRVESVGSRPWGLVFRDQALAEVAHYDATTLVPGHVLTTPPLDTRTLNIRVEGAERPTGVKFVIAEQAFEKPRSVVQPPQSVSRGIPIHDAPMPLTARPVASATARILFPGGVPCTGFLIREDLVLTNFHCVRFSDDFTRTRNDAKVACSDVEVRFDYDGEDPANRGVATPCLAVARFKEDHDFAVLRIDPERIKKHGKRRAPVSIAWNGPVASEMATIVGHPLGLPKTVAPPCTLFTGDDVVEFPATGCDLGSDPHTHPYFQHDCDTWPGNSGSPVIGAADGSVVALHYCGELDPGHVTPEQLAEMHKGKRPRNRCIPLGWLKADLKGLTYDNP